MQASITAVRKETYALESRKKEAQQCKYRPVGKRTLQRKSRFRASARLLPKVEIHFAPLFANNVGVDL